MSMLWMDSFDGGSQRYAYLGYASLNFVTGRNGNGVGNGAGGVTIMFPAPVAIGLNTGFVEFAYSINATPSGDHPILAFTEGLAGTTHCALYVNNARKLVLKLGLGGSVIQTGSTVLNTGTFYHIGIAVKTDNASGTYEVKIDGATEFSGSGDTRNGGTAGSIDYVNFYVSNLLSAPVMDDLIICDDQGSLNNTWRGNTIVQNRLAVPGNGGMTDFTCSTGTDHGALVDETTSNSDTDYNSSSTPGHIDTYNMQDISLSGTVLGAQVILHQRKVDVGPRTINAACRVGGTNYTSPSPTVSPTTAYLARSFMFETDPSTAAAWASQAAVNAAEFGMTIAS